MSTRVSTVSGKGPEWVTKMYELSDSLDVEVAVTPLADDVEFTFGNGPTIRGKAAVREQLTEFYGLIKGMKHSIAEVWTSGDDVIVVATVDYTRLDDAVVTVHATCRMHHRDGIAERVHVCVDMTPVFAD